MLLLLYSNISNAFSLDMLLIAVQQSFFCTFSRDVVIAVQQYFFCIFSRYVAYCCTAIILVHFLYICCLLQYSNLSSALSLQMLLLLYSNISSAFSLDMLFIAVQKSFFCIFSRYVVFAVQQYF